MASAIDLPVCWFIQHEHRRDRRSKQGSRSYSLIPGMAEHHAAATNQSSPSSLQECVYQRARAHYYIQFITKLYIFVFPV